MNTQKTAVLIFCLCVLIQSLSGQDTDRPAPRWGHSMVTLDSVIYIFGGTDDQPGSSKRMNNDSPYNDLWHFWEFSFLQYESQDGEEELPPQRYNHAVSVRHQLNSSMFVTGGRDEDGPINNDLYIFYPSGGSYGDGSWGEIHCNIPQEYAPRYNHTATVIGDHAYILGGIDETGDGLSEFWQYGFFTGEWTSLENFPTRISGHGSLALDDDHILVFCGGDPGTNTKYDRVYHYTISTNTWEEVGVSGDPMPGVQDFGFGVDEQGQNVYMLGGMTEDGLQTDLYRLDISGALSSGFIVSHNMGDLLLHYFTSYVNCQLAFFGLTDSQGMNKALNDAGYLYLFGGKSEAGVAANQMMRYDVAGNQWAELADGEWQDIGTGIDEAPDFPSNFILHQNYPNPFNPSTTISYTLKRDARVTLSVLDCLGREVSVLINETASSGRHEMTFEGEGLPSGLYLCRLKVGRKVLSRRMVLLK